MNMSTLLNFPPLSHIRRNHALEHATIQILSARHRGIKLAGRSSLWGFYLYGDVPTEDVVKAVKDGLRRLKAGQSQLAIHPNCGSNFAVAGTIAGLGAFIALGGISRQEAESRKERLSRLPFACAIATMGAILAKPLGAIFQAHVTTQADLGNLQIIDVTREEHAGLIVHSIRTEG
jgi:hypothetical protein